VQHEPHLGLPARRLFAAAAAVIGTLIALAGVEIVARAAGYTPRGPLSKPEPPIHAPDPLLGWRPLPGSYQFGPYSPGAGPVEVTILPDGSRDTGAGLPLGRKEVWLVGDSFTMGWAVADNETFAWRLQERRPDLHVSNFGVGGYGTLQSLIVLEELFASDRPRPQWVIYGFIDHAWRNVAAPYWLWALSFNRHSVATPFAMLALDGGAQRHAPEAYPSLPLHEKLASVALLENALMRWRAAGREQMGGPVTKALLSEMAALCHANGAGFSAVVLTMPPQVAKTYASYGRNNGVDILACNQRLRAEDIVVGEVHPNGPAHRRWGDCIADALAERLF
jgi:hypothetical protein